MWCLYILKSDEKYYVGISKNPTKRLAQHQNKESYYTSRLDNIELVYTELFKTRPLAEKREKQIKGWSRAKKQALIDNDFLKLIKLAKNSGVVEE